MYGCQGMGVFFVFVFLIAKEVDVWWMRVCNLGNTISVPHSCKSWIWLFWVELILYSFTYLLSTCIKESVVFLFIFSSSLWILCCHLPSTSDFSYSLWFNHHSSHLSQRTHDSMHLIWMMMTAAAHWHIYIYPIDILGGTHIHTWIVN